MASTTANRVHGREREELAEILRKRVSGEPRSGDDDGEAFKHMRESLKKA